MSPKGEPFIRRKVWRMSANAPLGEIVTCEATSHAEEKSPEVSQPTDDSPVEGDWHSSSWDLLTGLTVKDYTERIPPQVLDRLFKD